MTREIPIRRWVELSDEERDNILARSESDVRKAEEAVKPIIEAVRERGDEAIREYGAKFDGADLSSTPIAVEPEEFDAAAERLDDSIISALDYAIENVTRYHRAQVPEAMSSSIIRPGVIAGERWTPIERVGLYVPRGRGSFPSMLYMLAVPAVLAGVEHLAVATPPGPDGSVDPACLYAARRCGVETVYRTGGSQAVAAFVYGTESIRPVDKIVGPGSSYVAAAKHLLSSRVDMGLPAGPSESMILADESADAHRVALDLAIEAEHGADSQAILVTTSPRLAEEVAERLQNIIESAPDPRRSFLRSVFTGYGGILSASDMEEGCAIVNTFAPEHLQIRSADPWHTLSSIRNAGEILLGEHSPFSVANYAVGANAVLPTGGKAKSYSGVSVRDFMKMSSVVYLSREGYEGMRQTVIDLADYEGFYTHALALRDREKP